jgi:hypothetical protein
VFLRFKNNVAITCIFLERFVIRGRDNVTFKRKCQMGRPIQNRLQSYLHQKDGGEEDRKQLRGMFVNRTKDYTCKVTASSLARYFPPEDLI